MRHHLLGPCAAIALCNAALAQPPADRIAQRVPEPYSGYALSCGYPIIFKDTAHVSQAHVDRRLGPVITLDPMLDTPFQDAHRRFLIAHECAHHKLGHTNPEGLRSRLRDNGVEDQELSADCWSAEVLTRANLKNDVRRIADQLYRKGLRSPGAGYPSGVQRSTILLHCINSADRKMRAAAAAGAD